MGNQQSTENHQLTPEQYQQYQYFLQQQNQNQRPQQQQQPMMQPNPQFVNRPVNRPVQPTQNINPQRVVQRPIQTAPTQNAFHNQQQQRTQIRTTNQNGSHQMIPNLQQKSQMPSIENNYQNAYQQRLNENIKFTKVPNQQPPQEPEYMYMEPPNMMKAVVHNSVNQTEYLEQEKIREQMFLNSNNNNKKKHI